MLKRVLEPVLYLSQRYHLWFHRNTCRKSALNFKVKIFFLLLYSTRREEIIQTATVCKNTELCWKMIFLVTESTMNLKLPLCNDLKQFAFFLLFYWTLNIKLGKFDENSRNHRYTRLHRIFKVKFAELSSKNINTRQSEKYSKRKLNYGTKVGRRDQMRSQFRRKVIWPGIIVRFDGITPNKSSETRQQRKTLGETLLEAHIGNATRRTGRNFN